MIATDVLQAYLDRVAAAVLADDWPTYADAVALPCHLIMSDKTSIVADSGQLHQGFIEFRDTLRLHRVTDYIRLVQTAAFLDPQLLSGRYVTHLFVGGMRLMDPFHSQIVLRCEAGVWRAVSLSNSIANSRWARLMPASLSITPEKGTEE